MITRSLSLLILLLALATAGCSRAHKEVPTEADIEKNMRATWEKPATTLEPRTSLAVHSIKIGSGAVANEQDKIDGIPPGAWVTIALVDFTVRSYYTDSTQAMHRVRECKVYKDQFNEWAVMISRTRGEDQMTREPAAK
jgi:hypothetical protein